MRSREEIEDGTEANARTTEIDAKQRPRDQKGGREMNATTARGHRSLVTRWALAALLVVGMVATTGSVPASAARDKPTNTVMTYNVYLGANLLPLFGENDPIKLIEKAAAIVAHLDLVDFRVRAVAIAKQIVEQDPDVVALQEASLWETAPPPRPPRFTPTYDFLQILLDELERQGHPFRSVSVSANFAGALPIDFSGTLERYTDRNAILVPVDGPASELTTANPMHGVFDAGIPITIGGAPVKVTRGWASIDVTSDRRTYRVFDAHVEGYNDQIRLAQVAELEQIMSNSPYPVVLAGDLNLYPMGVRNLDAAAWGILSGAGFRDAWVDAECFEPRFTAGQTDDLNNVPSILDNTVDFVLYDADFETEPVERSCDIAGEELDDRTDTDPALWPSDHGAAIVDLRIAKT
jgi:endonuclease/exonuclease/phosphatase family metal-dependent hydrolase